jgi:hypothetical protein
LRIHRPTLPVAPFFLLAQGALAAANPPGLFAKRAPGFLAEGALTFGQNQFY